MPGQEMPEPAASFAALGVPAPLVEVLDDQGIAAPFPVQAATLPDALAGRDILGRARTGSGKTLGFSLPLVSRLAGGRTASGRPRGLVLVPTRELATQVSTVLRPLAGALDLWVTTIYGGVSYGPQVNALRRGTDIVVATPGRLADLIGQAECDLSDVEITVIDEADQMADLGFLPIVNRLLETTPGDGQRMLFSATLDAAVDVLARRFLSDPVLHSVDENSSPAEIEHHVLTVDAASRVAVIAALAGGDKRSLVFTRTKHGAERLARQLTQAGIPAAELHGNLAQGARTRNLAAFASGLARVMVATDIAARGIHIDGIELVIHADPPAEHKAYVHRSGRTARGGADGVVVTLQTKAQVRDVTAMMRKADIAPHPTVAVDPDSGTLTDIAGPAAPRVTVTGKVAELVKREDRLARNDRPGVGKPWEGRPRRDRSPRAGGRYGDGERRAPRADRSEDGRRDTATRWEGSASRDSSGSRDTRSSWDSRDSRNSRASRDSRTEPDASAVRVERDGRADRDQGRYRDDRAQRDDRTQRDGRDHRAGRPFRDQQQRDGRPYQNDQSNRDPRPYRDDRTQRDGQPYRDQRGDSQRGARTYRDDRGDRGGAQPYRDRDDRDGRSQPDGRTPWDRQPQRDDRAPQGGRPRYDERPQRGSYRDQRPSRDDQRPYGGDRQAQPESARRAQPGGRAKPGWRPAGDGQPFRSRSGRPGRPQSGGPTSGSSRRSGNSAGRGSTGNRRG